MWILYIIIVLLVIIVLVLSLALFTHIKKAPILDKKEKDFIEFAIDMYIEYAEELEINSKEQHEIVVTELNKIKKKFNGKSN